MGQAVEDVVAVAEDSGHVGWHYVIEVTQAVEIDVEDGDVRTESCRDLGGVGADHAAAEDGDIRRLDAGNAAEQDAAAIERSFEILGPLLDAHPARDLAHRR